METTQKTLIKQEAALMNEQNKLKGRRNASISRGRDASLNNTSVLSSVRVTGPTIKNSQRLHSGQKLISHIDDVDSQLFRQDDLSENKSEDRENMAFEQPTSQFNRTSRHQTAGNTSFTVIQPDTSRGWQVSNRTAFLVRRLLND